MKSSEAFPGNWDESRAATRAYRSVHSEVSVTLGRLGGGGRPRTCSGGVSDVTSDMSTNSRSRILFATLGAREAAGLNGPCVRRAGTRAAGGLGWLVEGAR